MADREDKLEADQICLFFRTETVGVLIDASLLSWPPDP